MFRLITHRAQIDDHVDIWSGKRAEIVLKHPDTYQIDGDVAGKGQRLVAEIDPGSLLVCVPSSAKS